VTDSGEIKENNNPLLAALVAAAWEVCAVKGLTQELTDRVNDLRKTFGAYDVSD
jgi:hypothetical protein